MARLTDINYENAGESIQKTYDVLKSKFGKILNIFRGMANNPVTLNAYLQLDELIAGGSFSPVKQDIVRITVSQIKAAAIAWPPIRPAFCPKS